MVYVNILVGLGIVLVAAATAIYFGAPNYQQTPPHSNRRRRNDDDEDAGEFDNGKKLHRHFTDQQTRSSKPGDKCSVCLDKMVEAHMQKMKCGHALHKDCFAEYRFLRRSCPLCSKPVNLSLPGDDCTICLEPLKRSDMIFLRCQHAMHKDCHKQFINSNAKACPICRCEL